MNWGLWRSVTGLVLSPVLVLLVLVVPSPGTMPANRVPVDAAAPSLAVLNQSLALADGFVQPLYRPLGTGRAVNSEYYGFPLRVHLVPGDRWLLLGEDNELSVSATESGFDWERFQVSINTRSPALTGVLDVRIAWAATRTDFSVTVTTRSFSDPDLSAALALNDTPLGEAAARRIGQEQVTVVPDSDRSVLASLRFTIRHSTEVAVQYYRRLGDNARAGALTAFVRGYGFSPDTDVYATLWGRADYRPDDYFNQRMLYHDCDVTVPGDDHAYAYQSKVCHAPGDSYARLTGDDTLVQALQAILALDQAHDSGVTYATEPVGLAVPPGGDLHEELSQRVTPSQTAATLERLYQAGGGIGQPRCLLADCEGGTASGVRTDVFGALEARLGYRYGDPVSRSYADAAAARLLGEQVGADGIVHTNRGDYYRPALRGAFVESWDPTGRADIATSVFGMLSEQLSMSPEYRGILVSNSETTIIGHVFLSTYRCLKYSVGCDGLGSLSATTAPATQKPGTQ